MENITPSSESFIVVGDSALTPEHRNASAILRANEFMNKYTKRDPETDVVRLNEDYKITREVAIKNVGVLAPVANLDPEFVNAIPYKIREITQFLPLLEVLSADPQDEL